MAKTHRRVVILVPYCAFSSLVRFIGYHAVFLAGWFMVDLARTSTVVRAGVLCDISQPLPHSQPLHHLSSRQKEVSDFVPGVLVN